jgi:4-hydroxy-tetrahydrodipicolinate reductase
MTETHHIHKLDKPSGTAVKLANDILAVNHDYDRWSIDTPAEHTLYINVTREGEVNGIHSVTAQSPADRITLTHEAFNRQGFALGAIAAAEFLVGKTGCYDMGDLFGK